MQQSDADVQGQITFEASPGFPSETFYNIEQLKSTRRYG